jgi:ribosome-binding protein aMBF1 (putative translation factor)
MPKVHRPVSPYAAEAAKLLGELIRKARITRKMKTVDVTARAGISRGLLRRIENGDLGCTIGAVLEVAAIVGVQLFDAGPAAMTAALDANREVMALLPRRVRSPRLEVRDDF